MKKMFALMTATILFCTTLVGCSSGNNTVSSETDNNVSSTPTISDDSINIVCTIFPIYDWVSEVVGDVEDVNTTFLIDSGIDLHSYQPSVDDIIAIQNSDLFIYVGGDSDVWVDNVVSSSVKSINLMEYLGDAVVTEEIVEGMQDDVHEHDDHDHDDHDHDDHDHDDHDHDDHDHDDHDHDDHDHDDHDHDDHDHDDHDHDDHDDHEHYDEHIWLSLKIAQDLVDMLSNEISTLSPNNSAIFSSNASNFIKELVELDVEYTNMVNNAELDTILVADRFPLRYLVDDYGLNYFAAFSGCSADVEVSFETIKFLTDKVNELELKNIINIDEAYYKIASTISSESPNDINILSFDSMQGTTEADVKAGKTYLSVMKENLKTLETALN